MNSKAISGSHDAMDRSILKVGGQSKGKCRFKDCSIPNVSFHEHKNEVSVYEIKDFDFMRKCVQRAPGKKITNIKKILGLSK